MFSLYILVSKFSLENSLKSTDSTPRPPTIIVKYIALSLSGANRGSGHRRRVGGGAAGGGPGLGRAEAGDAEAEADLRGVEAGPRPRPGVARGEVLASRGPAEPRPQPPRRHAHTTFIGIQILHHLVHHSFHHLIQYFSNRSIHIIKVRLASSFYVVRGHE